MSKELKSGLFVSLLFAIACCLPALEFRSSTGTNDVMRGARALVVGWSGIFAGVMGWSANPFWLLGLVLLSVRKPKLAALAGVVAVAIASSTFSAVGRELRATLREPPSSDCYRDVTFGWRRW